MIKSPLLVVSALGVAVSQDPLGTFEKALIKTFGTKPKFVRSIGTKNGKSFPFDSLPIMQSGHGKFNGRVLFVVTNSYPFSHGGYAVRTHSVLKALNKVGVFAEALTRYGYPADIGSLPAAGTDIIEGVAYHRSLPWVYSANKVRQIEYQTERIVEWARKLNVSVLHTTSPWTNALSTSRAAQVLDIPWVYEVRGQEEDTWAASQENCKLAMESSYYQEARSRENEAMHAAGGIVTLSQVSKGDLVGRGIEGRISIVPNAAEISTLGTPKKRSEARHALGLRDGRYVGAISSMVEYEGFDVLIECIERLPPDVMVLLVGDGAAKRDLQRLAKFRGVADRVVFAGRQPPASISDWYAALDVFVLPRKEYNVTRFVTPIKPLAAAAYRLPIVASDLPALREVTCNTAFYCKPNSPESLAQGIYEALSSSTNERTALSVPSWEDVVGGYLELYESLL